MDTVPTKAIGAAAPGTLEAGGTEAEKIARFTRGLTLDAIPEAVRTLAKEHLLDVLGIALASSRFDFGRVILNGAGALGRGDEATAIGSGERLPATSAALVNGVLAHGLDFDDTHIASIYHASAQAMAAVMASGQANGATGQEALIAFVAALEVGCRLATVGAGVFHDRGLHPTAMCGTFASAVAAGRLSGADQQAFVWSLGICGSQAAGILERGNSWLKRLHPGWAAHCGLSAVALGRAGFIGPDTVFEGRRGFYQTHTQSVPTGDALPSARLGETWQTLGIALKPYPCCHFIHAFVDAALELRERFAGAGIATADIERIECPLTPGLHKMVAEPRERCIRPATIYSALFSVQYVVALALVRGRVDLAAFYDDPLDAPDILRVAARAHCVPDKQSDYPAHFPGEVIVTLRDGRIFRCRKAASLGTPDVPLSRAGLEAKFLSNATRAITPEAAAKLIAAVTALESAPSLERIMALCTTTE